MEIYQIKVFLEVARCLSFTEAAEALNLTQPAISAKIKALETELGTPLFHRLGRKVKLTKVGEFLQTEAPSLIHLEARLLNQIQEIKRGKIGILQLGFTAGIGDEWLPRLLFQFRQEYPEIQTQCTAFDSPELLYQAVTNGAVDGGISEISFAHSPEISAITLDTIAYQVMVAASHPLAAQSWLSLRELQQEPWVLLPTGTTSRLVFETRLSELGWSLADFAHLEVVDSVSLMRTYILQGGYLGFASSLEFSMECQSHLMQAIDLQEFPIPANLFLLTPKRLNLLSPNENQNYPEAKLQSKTCDSDPLQKFLRLVHTTAQSAPPTSIAHPTTTFSSLPPPPPARLRSPSLTHRAAPSRPDVLTLSIGTQNGTIHTVTAGLIIQKLGLLEHFLPKSGRYSATQYQIQWQDFASGAPIASRLRSAQLDIGILGDYPLLLSAVPEADSTACKTRLISFIASNPSGSGNAVIVPNHSSLSSIADLQGRVIAVPFGSSAHGMMIRSLHRAELLADVTLTPNPDLSLHWMPQPPASIDGYAHFAPFHEIARRSGCFKPLLDTHFHEFPAFHGIAVREEFADRYPELVIAYLQALLAAQYWYFHTASAPLLVSQWLKVTPEVISHILSGQYHREQTGLYFPETQIRPDWVRQHIDHLKQISGNEHLGDIDLDRWIQSEFLAAAQSFA
ncbi:LysR family transcriptional regulator [Egbenema bharatensis]|uniref:LysR family transcriptional regulator n=1 Tax=Egbenema bharatensis TaxID=3463334 RepID=UPI003A85CEE9